MSDFGPGIPGWFIALIVVMLVLGVGSAIWRVSVARKMAQDAGLDPNTATAVTLLGNDGVGSTYLASTLAARSGPPPAVPARTVEDRLMDLQTLRDKGLVSDDEYRAQRQNILGSL